MFGKVLTNPGAIAEDFCCCDRCGSGGSWAFRCGACTCTGRATFICAGGFGRVTLVTTAKARVFSACGHWFVGTDGGSGDWLLGTSGGVGDWLLGTDGRGGDGAEIVSPVIIGT